MQMLKYAASAALAVGLGLAALATPASAATILIFAQNHATPPGFVVIHDNGDGTTSLSTDIAVTITDLAGPLVPPPITDATFKLTGASTSAAATVTFGGTPILLERFSGTFEITAPECGAGNCLSGTFTDIMFGPVGGRALTLAANAPDLTFTSDVIPGGDLVSDQAMALSKTNLTVPVTMDCSSPIGCTLATTSANVSGTFSADTAVPEPSTWAMMILGFFGLGFVSFRSSKTKLALID
jgi:hypothetical protein